MEKKRQTKTKQQRRHANLPARFAFRSREKGNQHKKGPETPKKPHKITRIASDTIEISPLCLRNMLNELASLWSKQMKSRWKAMHFFSPNAIWLSPGRWMNASCMFANSPNLMQWQGWKAVQLWKAVRKLLKTTVHNGSHLRVLSGVNRLVSFSGSGSCHKAWVYRTWEVAGI